MIMGHVLRKEFVSVRKVGLALAVMRENVQVTAQKEESAKKVNVTVSLDGQETHAILSRVYQTAMEMEFV